MSNSQETQNTIDAAKVEVVGSAIEIVGDNELIRQTRNIETGEYTITRKRPARSKAATIRSKKNRFRGNHKIQEKPFVL